VEPLDTLELSAQILASFVSNNSVRASELPALIETIHAAMVRLKDGAPAPAVEEAPKEPAVAVRRSITPDYLICLEDGKRFKSLKRHLGAHGLTPKQYREKWKLPPDYPMVAPNYAAQRSALAKKIGLGQGLREAGSRKGKRGAKAPKSS
jgi:predicted transcriptional regulator